MYGKLFARVAQSSLMEAPVPSRYVFMMMIAIADQRGEIIGTDTAIARILNISIAEFADAMSVLTSPDPQSNSPAEEGRRIVSSENGRGYKLVNYLAYRDMKSDDEKREYMRNYMRERRHKEKQTSEPVKNVNFCKTALSDVTHTEAEAEAEAKAEAESTFTKVKDRKAKKSPFIPPSIDELRVFAKECGILESDGEAMFYHWEGNGWKNGANAVKSWQMSFRKWQANGWLPSQKSGKTAQKPQSTFIDRNPHLAHLGYEGEIPDA